MPEELTRLQKDVMVGLIRRAMAPLVSDTLGQSEVVIRKELTGFAEGLLREFQAITKAVSDSKNAEGFQPVIDMMAELKTLAKRESTQVISSPDIAALTDKLDEFITLQKTDSPVPKKVKPQEVTVANLKDLKVGKTEIFSSSKFPFVQSATANSTALKLVAPSVGGTDAMPIVNPDGSYVASNVQVTAQIDKTGLATDTGQVAEKAYLGGILATLLSGVLQTSASVSVQFPAQQNVTISGTQSTTSGTPGLIVVGDVKANLPDTGSAPVKAGGVFHNTFPVYLDGQRAELNFGSRGGLRTELFVSNSTTSANYLADSTDGIATSGTANKLGVVARPYIFNGVSWDRPIGTAGVPRVNAAPFGQTVASGSLPVVIASDQSPIPVTGSFTATPPLQQNVTISGSYGEQLSRIVNPVTLASGISITPPIQQNVTVSGVSGVVTTSGVATMPIRGDSAEITGLTAGSLNADLLPATDVSGYKALSITVGGTFSGTLIIQGSNDGATWSTEQYSFVPANNPITNTGIFASTWSSVGGDKIVIPTHRYLRIRMTSYVSGSATGIVELFTIAPAFPVGSQFVVGATGAGSAVSGNPVQIGGSDGTNVQRIRTDGNGIVQVASTAEQLSRIVNPVTIASGIAVTPPIQQNVTVSGIAISDINGVTQPIGWDATIGNVALPVTISGVQVISGSSDNTSANSFRLAVRGHNSVWNGTSWDLQRGQGGSTLTHSDAPIPVTSSGVAMQGFRNDAAGVTASGVANGGIIPVATDQAGRLYVVQKSSNPATSNVASSASSVILLPSNTARIGAQLFNDSTQICYVKFGVTASTSSFTVALAASTYYEVPAGYTGRIDGIWASANGNMRVTEET